MTYDRTKKTETTLKDIGPIEHGPCPFVDNWIEKQLEKRRGSSFPEWENLYKKLEPAPEEEPKVKKKTR